MRSGTDHYKFIFKVPYYLEFLSLNLFYEKKNNFHMPLKKQGVGVMFYTICFSNGKETCQI